MEDLKQIYEKYKFELPDIDDLEEFDILEIDSPLYMLKKIRHKIVERIEETAKIIEDLLSSDSQFRNLYECKSFEDKDDLTFVYKKLMYAIRWSDELNIVYDEKQDAKFIVETTKMWKELKSKIIGIIQKIKDSWLKKDDITNEHQGYFG